MLEESTNRVYDGRYQLQEALGAGTTATVYRCRDLRLGLTRAIKILSPRLAHLESMRQRFEREAKTTSSFDHPNIVQIHDWGADHGDLYIVMELIAGGTLREKINAGGPMRPRKAAALMQQALHAMQYAHTLGVVHRDIKPRNIMISALGTPMITDFGIARVVGDDAENVTRPGAVMGTWGYMAPEQRVDSGQVDNRTDIYAAGCTLYTLLTDQPPPDRFDEPAEMEWTHKMPLALVKVVRGATRHRPEDRFQTAARLAEALAEAHKLLPAKATHEEATIMVERVSTDSVVRSKQLDFSDLEEREEAALARKEARRRRLQARRGGDTNLDIDEARPPLKWLLLGLGVAAIVGLLVWIAT